MCAGFLKLCLKLFVLFFILFLDLKSYPVGLPVRAGLTIVWVLAFFAHFVREDRAILARWLGSGENGAYWEIPSVGLGSWKMCPPGLGALAVLRPKKNRARANRKAVESRRPGEEKKFADHILCYPFLSSGSPVLQLGSVSFPPLCTTVVKPGRYSVSASFEYSIRVKDPLPLARAHRACERLYRLADATLNVALHRNFGETFDDVFSNKTEMTSAALVEWQMSFNADREELGASATCSLKETTVIPYAFPYEEYRASKEEGEDGGVTTDKLKKVLERSGIESKHLDLELLTRMLRCKTAPDAGSQPASPKAKNGDRSGTEGWGEKGIPSETRAFK